VENGHRETGRLISTGPQVYVRTGDRTYAQSAVPPLAQIHLADWFEDPELSGAGTETDRVHAGLDTPAAAEDLIRLTRQTGISLPGLNEASPKLLRAATRSASVDLYTRKRDRLLRRLDLRAEFGFDVPIVGRMARTMVTLRLEIDDLSAPVRFPPPG
jgi:hypothetical protein